MLPDSVPPPPPDEPGKICANCGHVNSPSSYFCTQCNAPLTSVVIEPVPPPLSSPDSTINAYLRLIAAIIILMAIVFAMRGTLKDILLPGLLFWVMAYGVYYRMKWGRIVVIGVHMVAASLGLLAAAGVLPHTENITSAMRFVMLGPIVMNFLIVRWFAQHPELFQNEG